MSTAPATAAFPASAHPPEPSSARPPALARTDGGPAGPASQDNPADVRRLLDSVRVILAILAIVLVLHREAPGPTWLVPVALAFGTYAAVLRIFRLRRTSRFDVAAWIWIDAAWCLALLAGTGCDWSFLALLLFPFLFAAVRDGGRQVLPMTLICAAAATILLAQQTPPLPWTRVLLPPSMLLSAGLLSILLAQHHWQPEEGRDHVAEMVARYGPRQGVESIARTALEALSVQFEPDVAVLALLPHHRDARVFVSEGRRPAEELSSGAAPNVALPLFVQGSEECAIVDDARRWFWQRRRPVARLDLQGKLLQRLREMPDNLRSLASLLDQPRMMIVLAGHDASVRLGLILARGGAPFEASMVEPAHHALEQLAPLFDNAVLVERLVNEATEVERARIGRDLHDSAIQPYIGLKLAIEALLRRVPESNPLHHDVRRLLDMAEDEILSMRDVVSGLRKRKSGSSLLASAVRRQVRRFSELSGITVEVSIEGEMPAQQGIAREVVLLVAESLSNIRRHTRARRAELTLQAIEHELVLRVRNEIPLGDAPARPFEPRSLSERAAELGGSLRVQSDAGGTTLEFTLPLPTTVTA